MLSRGDGPGVRTLVRINASSSRPSRAEEAGRTAPSVRRKRALKKTAAQKARKKKNNNTACAPLPLPPATQAGSQSTRRPAVSWSKEEAAQLMLWF